MKISLVQYNPEWENPVNNIAKIEKMILDLPETDLLIFPELSLTGFTMKSQDYGEEADGISMKYFISLAQRLKKDIFAGVIENDNGSYFNNLIHFDRNGLIAARYRKIHPFSYADEDRFYSPGDELVVTKINKIRFGLTVCYDLRFPELYRKYTKEGVDMLINIANWPSKRILHWQSLLRARAIENLSFMIGVNRTGTDPYNEYNGCSGVYSPLGDEIVSVVDDEKIITVDINTDEVAETRARLPFLNDIKLI